MKLFVCTNCGQVLYFENTWCAHCGYHTGLYANGGNLYALSAPNDDAFVHNGTAYSYCFNYRFGVCNWLVPAGGLCDFCAACDLNRTIPNLQEPQYREYWRTIEAAKHRLVYSLLRMHLPLVSKKQDIKKGLCFDFVADEKDKKIFTGHDNGLVTINIAEADDIKREMERKNMHEAYRTVSGHLRHEVGHYYWNRLVEHTPYAVPFITLFGDYTKDYGEALKRHYVNGAPPGWMHNYISAYASSHPWEDWAETWAHYLHIMDTLETAYYFGLQVKPLPDTTTSMTVEMINDPYNEPGFGKIISQWLPLTYAMNSLNRSMGVNDIYPFVIPPPVMQKLLFIHNVCFETKKGHY
ncbi:MAG TPA: putative zinc-binding metallopeptidase [Chitinophagaceae bacterium]|nr:putative zinc-binding metallopeptidase [Chitinophagaceae bacterium]